jgi:alkaline phosphatase D
MKHLHFLLTAVLIYTFSSSVTAQCGLQSGPMNGYSEMLEAAIWVQTKCPQTVQIRYWVTGASDITWLTDPVKTSKDHGDCAHLIADQVTPGNTYQYALLIDNAIVSLPFVPTFKTQTLWQYRTDPPNFTFVAGSCNFVNEPAFDRPGRTYGNGYHIFETIAKEKPDLMIWLGDNIYLREVDWSTKTGIYHRYSHMRAVPQMQPLMAQTHHYATWDDHDYGPNNCDRSFWQKDLVLQAFKDFWINPNYGAGGTEGITGTFFWQDCQFFVLDDRWYRGPAVPESPYLGDTQLNWLVDALRYSSAPYKFICNGGQVVSNAALFENYAVFAQERRALIDSIDKYNIKGVVFLTGDRHHSEISRMVTSDGDVIHDITSSALTSSTAARPDEPNHHRIPGTMIGVNNYALISVSGPRTARVCRVEYKDSNGNGLYVYEVK